MNILYYAILYDHAIRLVNREGVIRAIIQMIIIIIATAVSHECKKF